MIHTFKFNQNVQVLVIVHIEKNTDAMAFLKLYHFNIFHPKNQMAHKYVILIKHHFQLELSNLVICLRLQVQGSEWKTISINELCWHSGHSQAFFFTSVIQGPLVYIKYTSLTLALTFNLFPGEVHGSNQHIDEGEAVALNQFLGTLHVYMSLLPAYAQNDDFVHSDYNYSTF